LAIATAISAWTHAILLYVGLHQNGQYRFGRIVAVSAAKTVFASAVLGLGLLYLPPSSESWVEMQPVARLGGTTLVMTLGLLGYLVVLLLMGIRPKHFEHQIKRG
jgi:putative peptidoglycan lipid II flippase